MRVLVLLFLFNILLGAQEQAARKFYDEGRYEEAYRAYQSCQPEDAYTKGLVEYNLGNCAFLAQRYGWALCHYRRAEMVLVDDKDLCLNLALVCERLDLNDEPDDWWPAVRQRLAAPTAGKFWLLWTSITTANLFALILWRRHWLPRLFCLLLLGVLLFGAVNRCLADFQDIQVAIVVAEDGRLRPQPHDELPTIANLHLGEELRIVESTDNWAYVVAGKDRGWLRCSSSEIID